MHEEVDDNHDSTTSISEPPATCVAIENGKTEKATIQLMEPDSNNDHLNDEKHVAAHQAVLPRTVYKPWETYMIVMLASFAALFSTISAPIYLPAIPVLGEYFNVTTEKINLTVTMYSIFQGITPTIWSPLADTLGRRPVYMGCILIYIGADIGLALCKDYTTLFILRCVQAAGIASVVAIGSGVVTDITTQKDRGRFIGIYSGISLIGNAFGPLIGGGLASSLGWRAIFWFLAIAASIMLLIQFVFLLETNRHLALDGSVIPRNWINRAPYLVLRRKITGEPHLAESDLSEPLTRPKVDIFLAVRMFKCLDVSIMLIPSALHYTSWFMILTAQSTLLSRQYHFSTSQIGCSYLASGIGGLIGSLSSGRAMDMYYRRCLAEFESNPDKSRQEDFDIVRARLNIAWYPSLGMICGCIAFGWPIEKNVHFIVPLLATALCAFSSVFFVNLIQTLLVDLFPDQSASSTACLNLTRCLVSAAGLAAVDVMVEKLGAGGAFTVMAGLCALSLGCVFAELKIGFKMYRKRMEASGSDEDL